MIDLAPPIVLSIAGSDPSGGAGIQADLKAFTVLGAYGCAAVTALTAQSTRGVTGVHPVPPAFVREQIETLVADISLDAVKIGMLANAQIIDAVTDACIHLFQPARIRIVLDPVMVATSGARLLDADAVDAMRGLVSQVSAVTPNLHEAATLLHTQPAHDTDAMRGQATKLLDLGVPRVLVKGGHGDGTEAIDIWAEHDTEPVALRQPRIATSNTHGTGCSLSSAIAALLPQRDDWFTAVCDAKSWLTGALIAGRDLQVGHGSGPVDHLYTGTFSPGIGGQ